MERIVDQFLLQSCQKKRTEWGYKCHILKEFVLKKSVFKFRCVFKNLVCSLVLKFMLSMWFVHCTFYTKARGLWLYFLGLAFPCSNKWPWYFYFFLESVQRKTVSAIFQCLGSESNLSFFYWKIINFFIMFLQVWHQQKLGLPLLSPCAIKARFCQPVGSIDVT